MAFIDFATLKQRVAIETMLPPLQLEMREANGQFRGPCPVCQSGGKRALVVTPAKSAFYCFGGHIGGDVIALVAHVRDCSMKQAAEFLADETGQGSGQAEVQKTVPEERSKEATRSLQPLTYLQAC
jgi:DNA primase